MALLTSLLLSLTTLLAVVLFVVRRLLMPAVPVKGTTNIPGPTEGRRWPIVGHALLFWGVKDTGELYRIAQRLIHMREKLMSFYAGSKLVIMVSDAKILEAIISTNKCKAKEVEFYDSFNKFTNGVFSKNGKGWSFMRRPLDKLLHPKHMDSFHLVFTNKANILCCNVGDRLGKGVFDIKHLMEYCTLDITLETVLKVPGTQQIEDTMNIPELIPLFTEMVFQRQQRIIYKIDWIFYFSSLGRQDLMLRKRLRPTLKEMMDNCFRNLKRTGRDPADPDFIPENFIEIAIQAGISEKNTEEEIVFSFFDMIIAGFHTTAVAMSSALIFLAMHPEYQEKAYQEQMEVMIGSLEAPSKDELSRMNYIEMVLNETLRHVSVPAIARTISDQFTIDGYIFPEGASLFILYHHLFKNPKYWERSNDFYPDHFLPEKVAKRPKGAFLPFSFGGRSCPGKLFGTQSSKLILSMLLRRFKFTTCLKYEDIVYKYMIMQEFENGYPLEVTARTNLTDMA